MNTSFTAGLDPRESSREDVGASESRSNRQSSADGSISDE